MKLNRDWIAFTISNNLRFDDVMYELEHYISVQAGGYTKEEEEEADKQFYVICGRIADEIWKEVKDQIAELKTELRQVQEEAERDSTVEAVPFHDKLKAIYELGADDDNDDD